MLARVWKKVGFIILIIACLYNIVGKLIVKVSFDNEIKQSAKYVEQLNNSDQKN